MEIKRRTQEERSAATRDALIAAARKLWGLRGYAEVGTPEIVAAAGVTRGAMYHQFTDKAALFSEVIEVVEQDVMARMANIVASSGATTPADAIRAAVDAWLEVSADPEVRQLILLDAPSVLGWPAFRAVPHFGAACTGSAYDVVLHSVACAGDNIRLVQGRDPVTPPGIVVRGWRN